MVTSPGQTRPLRGRRSWVTISTWGMLASLYRLQMLWIHCLDRCAIFTYSQSVHDDVNTGKVVPSGNALEISPELLQSCPKWQCSGDIPGAFI